MRCSLVALALRVTGLLMLGPCSRGSGSALGWTRFSSIAFLRHASTFGHSLASSSRHLNNLPRSRHMSDSSTVTAAGGEPGTPLVSRGVIKVVTAHKQREGGGFVVRRPVGGAELSYLSPFLMLDHLGPVTYGPGEAVGAPDHPHRGFETVTYVLEGGFHHKDSAGNEGNLRDGWCQWMTAGRGVVHSEMPTAELLRDGGRMEGFQLWVNLPAKDKMVPPRYQDTPGERLPWAKTEDGKVSVKVIAGEALGARSPIETRFPLIFLDVRLQPHSSFRQPVPSELNAFVYVHRGKGQVGSERTSVSEGQAAVAGKEGNVIDLHTTDEEMRCLLLAGMPINEPVARYGPFVMNTQAEIRQAFADYEAGRLGEIAGAEERYEATRQAVKAQKQGGTWDKDQKEL